MRLPFTLRIVLAASPVVAAPPGVFTTGTIEQVRRIADSSGKLFVVDATAAWCAPCRIMDGTTWSDERVVEWIGEHAVAVQLDVDGDPALARELGINAMPTIVVFKAGEEFDRVVGYRTADDLLEWLNGVREGRRAIEALRGAAAAKPDGRVDVEARLRLAQELARTGRLDEATAEFVWLWENMLAHEPAMYGARLSFMVGDMTELARRHPPAREAFTKMRDRYTRAVARGLVDRDVLVDWLHLNKVIGDDDATLAWYEAVKDRVDRAGQIELVQRDLYELLVERRRWADAGAVLRDPVGRAEWLVELNVELGQREDLAQLPESKRQIILRVRNRMTERDLLDLYASCLVAGRGQEAGGVAEVLLTRFGDDALARLELVQIALGAGKVTRQHIRWLDEAEALGEAAPDLREQVQQALGADGE